MARAPKLNYSTYRDVVGIRHSRRLLAWMVERGTALGRTTAEIFAYMQANKASSLIGRTTIISLNRILPTIAGTKTSGSTLTCTAGTWTGAPAPVITRAWLRDNVVISGATALTYVLVAGDVTKKISVRETATNSSGAVTATSVQTITIT